MTLNMINQTVNLNHYLCESAMDQPMVEQHMVVEEDLIILDIQALLHQVLMDPLLQHMLLEVVILMRQLEDFHQVHPHPTQVEVVVVAQELTSSVVATPLNSHNNRVVTVS